MESARPARLLILYSVIRQKRVQRCKAPILPCPLQPGSLPAICTSAAPMRADAGYLARNNLEIVEGGGNDAAVMPANIDSIAALATGKLRLRQRPAVAVMAAAALRMVV